MNITISDFIAQLFLGMKITMQWKKSINVKSIISRCRITNDIPWRISLIVESSIWYFNCVKFQFFIVAQLTTAIRESYLQIEREPLILNKVIGFPWLGLPMFLVSLPQKEWHRDDETALSCTFSLSPTTLIHAWTSTILTQLQQVLPTTAPKVTSSGSCSLLQVETMVGPSLYKSKERRAHKVHCTMYDTAILQHVQFVNL